MSTSTPPPAASGESLPAATPSLPGVPLWSDSDPPVPAAAPAVAAFAGLVAKPVDGAMPTIGHIGRYALKYQLGIGGLGTVFAAHDPLLSRLIAVKTLNVQVADDERESFNAMFINEARAAGGLSHPHIVTVFDAGISNQRAYIAMELLKGRDLRQLRQEGWRATPAEAALIVRRVADALAFAHSKGVIHRDIKPANIFMVGRTQPRVLDFGIARVAHRQDSTDAHSGAGSPYYMAPEQVRRELSDRRADVFSLGVVLYELLTDVKPFNGETLAQIREAVLHLEPPLASKVDAAVPKTLAAIAARAMAKDADQRFRSARSFARELRQWLDENPTSPEGEVVVAATPPRRRLGLIVGGVLAVLVAASAGLWFGASSRSGDGAAAVATAAVTPAPVYAAPAPVIATDAPIATETAVAPADATAEPTLAPATPNPIATVATQAAGPAALPAAPLAGVDVVARSVRSELAAAVAVDATAADAASAHAAMPPPPTAVTAKAPLAANASARPVRESTRERRTREARERELRESDARIASAASLVAPPTGTVRIAISPWGQVEVDGTSSGAAPPITELTLAEGRHQIVIRNGDFTPYTTTVNVTAGQSLTVRHRFGS
ncbi:MAG: serine/threonine-protein kinase [Caldimonas sp.]